MRQLHGRTGAQRPEDRFALRALRAANVCFCRIYHRLELLTPCPVPRDGPAIVVCNHISGLDPAMIQAACPRLIVWMMAAEYYHLRGLRWLFELIEAIPVQRAGGRDWTATRRALRALEAGRVLGVFPEGRIEPDHNLLPFQTGAAMMAMRSGAPICPAYIDGTARNLSIVQAYLIPQQARLIFGLPLRLQQVQRPDPAAVESATNAIRQRVWELRKRLLARSLAKNPENFLLAPGD